MSEKLTESITFKCTYESKQKALRIFKAKKINSLSEYMDSLLTKDIAEVEDYLNTLIPVMSITTDTSDTFELTPPLRDVTPKTQITGTKKAQLCDQLSLIAIQNLSNE